MRVEQVQVDVENLVKGMYVCALDRPWLSTPFPFQGFVVRGEKDIAGLRKYCSFVYVDVLRGVPPAVDSGLTRSWSRRREEAKDSYVTGGGPVNDNTVSPTDIIAKPLKVNSSYYDAPKQLRKELKRAQEFHGELSRSIGQAIDDIRVGRGLDLKHVRRTCNSMIQSVIRHPDAFSWMIRLRDKDQYSYGHSVRSAVLAVVLARHLGLPEAPITNLAMGTLLCEVGKAKLPRHLLEKRDPLTDDDWDRIRSHVQLGVEILDRCAGIGDDIVDIVENHHERFDGSGYPKGKYGDQIPLSARIAGMVDAYDAMTSLKPYTKRVFSTPQALDFLYDSRNVLFHDQVVEEFIQALGIYPTGTLVELSTGEVALIIAQNVKQRLQPEMLVVLDRDKNALGKYQRVDLREFNNRHADEPVSIKRALASGEFSLDANAIMETHSVQKFDWRKKLAFG